MQGILSDYNKCNYQFIETFGLKKGLKRFGKNGYDAAMKEMQQLYKRVVFKPINVSELTQQEKKRAMESLIFLFKRVMAESNPECAQMGVCRGSILIKKRLQVQLS